ncbi:MAG: hypothetical protein OIF35_02280 [Cellvibrionaceae bacterium]|nr:hypothetical protein [Cellvibrionaceae bacterium]
MSPSNLKQLRLQIRHALYPDKPQLIQQWLLADRCCRRARPRNPCHCCDIPSHLSSLEAQYQLLLDTISDELLPAHWRCICLGYL